MCYIYLYPSIPLYIPLPTTVTTYYKKNMITENDICTAGLKDFYTGASGSINDSKYSGTPPDPVMVELCREFIRTWVAPTSCGKVRNSSYHMKHEVERWAGQYITNGAFILAALREGLQQEPTDGNSPNTWVYIKKKYNPYRNQPRREAMPVGTVNSQNFAEDPTGQNVRSVAQNNTENDPSMSHLHTGDESLTGQNVRSVKNSADLLH